MIKRNGHIRHRLNHPTFVKMNTDELNDMAP
jgi:hypothetical protein